MAQPATNAHDALMEAWGEFFQVPRDQRQFLRLRTHEFYQLLRAQGYDVVPRGGNHG